MSGSESEDDDHFDVDDSDLRFKEYELARRVGLESTTSHRAQHELNSTQLQLGNDAKGASIGLQMEDALLENVVQRRTTLGAFSRDRYGSLIDKRTIGQVTSRTQDFDAAQDVPLWFEKIRELEGVTDAETLIVQNEIMQNEVQMMRMWSREAQGLVRIKAEESDLRDVSELDELQKQNTDLERETIVSSLGMEAIASVLNPEDRKKLQGRNKGSRIKGERELLQVLENKRRELVYAYYKRSKNRDAELVSTLREGTEMLNQFGELLESTCNNMIQNNKSKLLEELHKHGIEVGRLKATDATNKLHRKILLNPLDRSENTELRHGELTLVLLPSHKPCWGYTHATDGPWRVRRYDKEMVRAVTRNAIGHVSMEYTNSTDALRALAKVLDAITIIDGGGLHQQVVDRPDRARELLQARITALGLKFEIDGVSSLQRVRNDTSLKSVIVSIVKQLHERLQYHGRFYFEVHFHSVDSVDCPIYDGPDPAAETWYDEERMRARAESDSGKEDVDVLGEKGGAPMSALFQQDPQEESKSIGLEAKQNDPAFDEDEPNLVEDYSEPDSDVWVIGVSFNTLSCKGFPGNDENSFGIRSDGTLWHAGRAFSFCGDLGHEVVIGLLLDLNTGAIVLTAGGATVGTAFGVDATTFSRKEQYRQSQLIRSNHLIPGFALKSRRERSRGSPSYRMQHRSTSRQQINNDDLAHLGLLEIPSKVPALSINFGGYSFSQLPPQSLSCDSYLSFATEVHKAKEKARFAEEMKNKISSHKGSGGMFRDGRVEDDFGDDNHDDDDDEDGPIGGNVVLEYQNRIKFFDEMQYPQPKSWSNFPPQAHRLGYSATLVQRAARRFLARKWRRKEIFQQTMAALFLQRRVRNSLPKWRRRKENAALLIQRVWRGAKARRQVQMAVDFARSPEALLRAATRIQTTFRCLVARRSARQAARKAEQQVFTLIYAAKRIQRRFRKHKEIERLAQIRVKEKAISLVQRNWRGKQERKMVLEQFGEKAKRKLLRLGISVCRTYRQNRSAVMIQKHWRGKADRDYAEMRRIAFYNSACIIQRLYRTYQIRMSINALFDVGPANAVKKFLKLLKGIY